MRSTFVVIHFYRRIRLGVLLSELEMRFLSMIARAYTHTHTASTFGFFALFINFIARLIFFASFMSFYRLIFARRHTPN